MKQSECCDHWFSLTHRWQCGERTRGQLIPVCNPSHKTGYSILELISALAIMAVLLAMAVPTFSKLLSDRKLLTMAVDFASSIELARSTAINTKETISMCASTDGSTCKSDVWHEGWILFQDEDGDLDKDTTETLVAVRKGSGDPITASLGTDIRRGISFNRAGNANFNTVTFAIFCDDRGLIETSQAVVATIAGRGSLLTASDAGLTSCTL